MKVIHGARGSGKTLELIKNAAKNKLTIVCLNQKMKQYTKNLARELGLEIPEPVTVEELRNRPDQIIHGKRDIKVVVDDADVILERFFNTKIYEITISE